MLLDSDASIRDSSLHRSGTGTALLSGGRMAMHLPYTNATGYVRSGQGIPPYLIVPRKRENDCVLCRNYRMDAELGRCMQIVSDNTLVVFSTEQGSAFPYGGKWTCYENGLHTGLIMRWPGKIEAGSSSDALVQYVDILPTLLEVAGGDPTRVDTGRAGAPDGGSGFDG